jgi:hypothetical protein
MAPAIQNILEENVASLRAVEQIQHALASTGKDRERLFERALAQAEGNVTEAEERPLLRRLRRVKTRALQGDAAALRQTLSDLERLAAINLAAMERADRQAARLGEGGAWAMAVLGMICFLVSIWAARKVARHITRPLARIHRTLVAFRGGDTRRRCAIHDAALEATEIAGAVDHLLDASDRPEATGPGVGSVARAALLALLEDEEAPTLVVSRAGEVVAANEAGLDALGQGSSLRDRVLGGLLGRGEDGDDPVARSRPVGDEAWIVRLVG